MVQDQLDIHINNWLEGTAPKSAPTGSQRPSSKVLRGGHCKLQHFLDLAPPFVGHFSCPLEKEFYSTLLLMADDTYNHPQMKRLLSQFHNHAQQLRMKYSGGATGQSNLADKRLAATKVS